MTNLYFYTYLDQQLKLSNTNKLEESNKTEELELIIPHISFCALKFNLNLFKLNDWQNHYVPHGNIKYQAQFVAGRICAKSAIFNLIGKNIWLGRNKSKAPSFPPSLCGSISHSKNYALAIVAKTSNYQSLGVDIEHIMSFNRANKIKNKILTSAELQNLPSNKIKLAEHVTLIFSLKESLYKALNQLMIKPLRWQSTQIILLDNMVKVELLDNALINSINFKTKINILSCAKIIDNKALTAVAIC